MEKPENFGDGAMVVGASDQLRENGLGWMTNGCTGNKDCHDHRLGGSLSWPTSLSLDLRGTRTTPLDFFGCRFGRLALEVKTN